MVNRWGANLGRKKVDNPGYGQKGKRNLQVYGKKGGQEKVHPFEKSGSFWTLKRWFGERGN